MVLGSLLSQASEGFLDLFFPRLCVECRSPGTWLCRPCRAKLASGEISFSQEGRLLSFFSFDEPAIRELMHHLKYNGIWEVAGLLANLAAGRITPHAVGEWAGGPAVLIPVPTTPSKRKTRGYNQAELIAGSLSQWLGWPVWPQALQTVSRRSRGTQVGKGAADRRAAAESRFRWAGKSNEFLGRSWVIVDDVMTTGSTMNACMRCAQERTLGRVMGLSIAATRGDAEKK